MSTPRSKAKRSSEPGPKSRAETSVSPHFLSAAEWTVAAAKARLSEVLDKASTEGPQTITRNGKRTAVVVGIEEWERKTKRKGSLADFLLASPLRGSDIDLERLTDEPRDILL